jgi:hypothetical protein
MYIEHRSDRVTQQCAAFHGASANPANSPPIQIVVSKKQYSFITFFMPFAELKASKFAKMNFHPNGHAFAALQALNWGESLTNFHPKT